MPRTNINYTNTSIYKLCCKDLNIIELYVGHTTDMKKRKNHHKTACNNEKDKQHNYDVYKFIRANGGWDNWDMIEIERFEAINGNDARKKERYYIETLKATLNMYIPTQTIKEYREKNREIINEYQNEYYEKNKEKINEKRKKDYKKYYEKNKEKINEKNKEKITCECGCKIRKSDLPRHKRSKKHINLIHPRLLL